MCFSRPLRWNKPSRPHKRATTTRSSCTTNKSRLSGRRLKRLRDHWINTPISVDSWPYTRALWRTNSSGTRGSSRMRTTGQSCTHMRLIKTSLYLTPVHIKSVIYVQLCVIMTIKHQCFSLLYIFIVLVAQMHKYLII